MQAAELAWLDFPVAPTAGGAVLLLVIVGYRLLTDRSAVRAEIAALSTHVDYLSRRVERFEQLYDAERGLKHQAFNDVARSVTTLDLVRRLAKECTCGVLTPLTDIIDRILDEMELAQRVRRQEIGEP